jgi:hypothetical protein
MTHGLAIVSRAHSAADEATEVPDREHRSDVPIAAPQDQPLVASSTTEGILRIDHQLEGIVNVINGMSLPKETPPMRFSGGLYLDGAFTAGGIEVDGTLIIGQGAQVDLQRIKCKRLYVNNGSVKAQTIEVDCLIAWDGVIDAEHLRYRALEETRHCRIDAKLCWIRD